MWPDLDDIALEIEQVIGTCFHMIQHGPGPEQATAENQEAILEANVYLNRATRHWYTGWHVWSCSINVSAMSSVRISCGLI